MRVKPYHWHGRPCIRVYTDAGDMLKLEDKQPTALDWLGRLLAGVENPDWECNAANVVNDGIIYVPEYRHFIIPEGKELEKSLQVLLQQIRETLQGEGLL